MLFRKVIALVPMFMFACALTSIAIDLDGADKERFEALVSLQDEMKKHLSNAQNEEEITDLVAVYRAKARNILSRPIFVTFNWDRSILENLFEVKAVRIRDIDVTDDGQEFFLHIELTIIARARIHVDFSNDLIVDVSGKIYKIGDFFFVDSQGAIVASEHLFHSSRDPIEPGSLGLLQFLFVPLIDVAVTQTIQLD